MKISTISVQKLVKLKIKVHQLQVHKQLTINYIYSTYIIIAAAIIAIHRGDESIAIQRGDESITIHRGVIGQLS